MFSKRTDWRLSPNPFTLAQEEMRSRGNQVIDLTVSNPTGVGFDYDADTVLGALGQAASLHYDPQPKGLRRVREAVVGYYRDDHQVLNLDPENTVLTTSTSEAYSYLFRLLCNRGDEVLVPQPSYPLFEFLADLEDVKLVGYPLLYDHGWQMDLSSLHKGLSARTRAVVAVHPNNPTGSYVHPDERSFLNGFCRANDLALIVDEVFLDYPHDGCPRPTFAFNPDVLTFTLSGLSKICGLPQMKMAWIVTNGPQDAVSQAMARLEVIADTYLSVSTPVQWAAPCWLEERKRIGPLLVDRIRINREEIDRQLVEPSRCRSLQAEGGWYAVLRVPATQTDEELAIEILRRVQVLVHPGHFYDFPGDGYLVVSLIPRVEDFRKGIEQVLKLLND